MQVQVPICLSHGEHDKSTPNNYLNSLGLYLNAATPWQHKFLQIVPQGRHNLFADRRRLEVFEKWLSFSLAALDGEFARPGGFPHCTSQF